MSFISNLLGSDPESRKKIEERRNQRRKEMEQRKAVMIKKRNERNNRIRTKSIMPDVNKTEINESLEKKEDKIVPRNEKKMMKSYRNK